MAFTKEATDNLFNPFVYHAEKHGLTSKIIPAIYKGCNVWKKQWFYKDKPTNFNRGDTIKECAQRNNIELKG